MYKKPVIIETSDLAEGIFAASGAQSGSWSKTRSESYGNGNGQDYFSVSIPQVATDRNVTITVTFDKAPDACWGLGGSSSINGNTVVITSWAFSGTGELATQSNNGQGEINITSVSVA